MARGDEPAFPVFEGTQIQLIGMTRRQWLVGMAMQGKLSSEAKGYDYGEVYTGLSKECHMIADAILEYEEREGKDAYNKV